METITSTMTDMLPTLGDLQTAYSSRNWLLLLGLVLTAAVTISKRLGLLALVPKEATKWVAVGMGMATGIGGGLILGQDWMTILGTGITAGLLSIGGHEIFGKMLKKKG